MTNNSNNNQHIQISHSKSDLQDRNKDNLIIRLQ